MGSTRRGVARGLAIVAGACTMFGALAPVAARPAAAATYTTFHFTNVKVPMRDGVKLEVNIWAPDVPAGVKVPVILTLSPYNILNFGPGPTDGTTLPDTQATWFVPRGYARAFADVRGTRNSEGCYDYGGLGEQHDGYDLVEWLGTQPWSNGSVGMVGTSYEGTTANAAAAQHPPHLKAIVPIASINKWYDYAYELGTRYFLNSEHATDEGIDTPAGFTYGFGIIPPFDPAGNPVNVVTRISPCDRVAQDQHGYNPQPDYDQYWKDRDYLAAEGTSGIPTWIVHGVLDSNVRTWEGTQVYAGTSAVRKLWLGQWPHADGSSRAGPEWQRQMTAWWDRWLMGIPNGIENEPAVDVQFNDGTWHTEQSWPPAGTGELRLFMRPIAGAAGSLDTFAPEYTGETIFDDPSLSENRMLQNPDMADPSRLAYRTGPLKKPLRIAGRPVADLWASTDQTSTHFAVELVDVDAAGKWKIIDRGFGNARYRNGLELGQDLTPNQPYEFRIPILDNDYTFPAGHSVGVLVSASNAVWALPDPQRANNTILHGPHTPSSLVLQVVDAAQFGPRPTPASAGAGSGLPGTSTASIGAPHLVVPLVALVLAGILLLGATIAPRGRRRL